MHYMLLVRVNVQAAIVKVSRNLSMPSLQRKQDRDHPSCNQYNVPPQTKQKQQAGA
jgi:hypothetical protein